MKEENIKKFHNPSECQDCPICGLQTNTMDTDCEISYPVYPNKLKLQSK